MVKYNCEKCGKEFIQKGHYTKHTNKKNPCVIESKLEEIIGKVVDEKMNEIKCNNETDENQPNDDDEPSLTCKITTFDYTIINCCCMKGLTDMKNENKKIHCDDFHPNGPYDTHCLEIHHNGFYP